MLYMSSANRIVRIHAPFVSDEEIEKVNNFIRSQAEPDYIDEILNFEERESSQANDGEEVQDELYDDAVKIIQNEGKASTSFLQRKLQIGYNRAARIIEMMETNGIVSKANHVGKREVLSEQIMFYSINALLYEAYASIEKKISEKLNKINIMSFNFTQTIDGKDETGSCTIKYPKKIFVNIIIDSIRY